MSYFDDASLVMIPSGYKDQKVYSVKPIDGSGDLTFSRASSATRVNSSGLVEKVRENLLLQSNTFNTTWVSAGTGGATITSGQADPDGGSSAWLLAKGGSTGRIEQNITMAANEQTFSVVAKKGTSDFLYFVVYDGTTGHTSYFNLNTGAVGTQSNAVGSIVSLGSGWYRCSLTSTNLNAAGVIQIYQSDSDGLVTGTTGNIYIYQSQFENGVATNYIETTTTAVSVGPVSGLPRLDYSGGASCPSLLLEPQRTNIALYSEQFDNAYWGKGAGVTLTANQYTSPDGYVSGDKLIGATGTDRNGDVIARIVSVSSSTTYVASIYVYKDTATQCTLYLRDGSTGTIVSTSVTLAAGWQRIERSITTGATTTQVNLYLGNTNGNIGIWGAQMEAGAYATSYIPTLSTAVTRVAESASKTGIASLIGQSEGSVFIDFDLNALEQSGQRIWRIGQSGLSFSNAVSLEYNPPNQLQFINYVSGVLNVQIIKTTTTSERLKVGVRYKENDFVMYINGVQIGTDTAATLAGSFADFFVGGNSVAASGQIGSGINQFLIFKTGLTNSQLAELTA